MMQLAKNIFFKQDVNTVGAEPDNFDLFKQFSLSCIEVWLSLM